MELVNKRVKEGEGLEERSERRRYRIIAYSVPAIPTHSPGRVPVAKPILLPAPGFCRVVPPDGVDTGVSVIVY